MGKEKGEGSEKGESLQITVDESCFICDFYTNICLVTHTILMNNK